MLKINKVYPYLEGESFDEFGFKSFESMFLFLDNYVTGNASLFKSYHILLKFNTKFLRKFNHH